MQPTTSVIDANSDDRRAHSRPTPRGGKRARKRIPGNTLAGRRVKAIVEMYAATLGLTLPVPGVLGMKLQAAAEMRAIAEEARRDRIAGGAVSLDDVVRAVAIADRLERALGIDGKPARPRPLTVQEHLAAKGQRPA